MEDPRKTSTAHFRYTCLNLQYLDSADLKPYSREQARRFDSVLTRQGFYVSVLTCKYNEFRNSKSRKCRQELRITWLLAVLSIKFMITHILPTVLDIWEISGKSCPLNLVYCQYRCTRNNSNSVTNFNTGIHKE